MPLLNSCMRPAWMQDSYGGVACWVSSRDNLWTSALQGILKRDDRNGMDITISISSYYAATWLYGAAAVNTTLFGIGRRTGNVPLEAMVFKYAQQRAPWMEWIQQLSLNLQSIVRRKSKRYHLPEPFVGKNSNVTKRST